MFVVIFYKYIKKIINKKFFYIKLYFYICYYNLKPIIMTIQELENETFFLTQDYKEVYNQIHSFTKYLINKGFTLDRLSPSFKSVSTYIDFSKEIDGFDEIITVRFSDHAARGNYGSTDVYYGSHLTLDENYDNVLEILEER